MRRQTLHAIRDETRRLVDDWRARARGAIVGEDAAHALWLLERKIRDRAWIAAQRNVLGPAHERITALDHTDAEVQDAIERAACQIGGA